jgi:L-fuculose-phosphate aldolase
MATDVREVLATAGRILADQGQEHFQFGHVSAREAPGAERFWVKPSDLGLGEVRASDLVLLDLDGNRLAGDGPLHNEMPIHAEVYRRRPGVGAVVHTHPFHTAALAASSAEFGIVSQDSLPFAPAPALYDSALLIVTRERGAAVAEALGGGPAVVLRNHGIVVADATVEGATVLAVTFERSVRTQHAAAILGEIREIEPAEVEEMRGEHWTPEAQAARAVSVFAYLRRQLEDGEGSSTRTRG